MMFWIILAILGICLIAGFFMAVYRLGAIRQDNKETISLLRGIRDAIRAGNRNHLAEQHKIESLLE